MKTEFLRADHPVVLEHAVDTLKHGGLVAFPTDTVYGLASLPFQGHYVDRLYIAKGRNSKRAIAVLLGDISQLPRIARDVEDYAQKIAASFWPGPLTLVLPRQQALPDVLSADPTVGVRIPDHPVALALLRLTGPLAVTSANLSGQENTTTAQEVMAQLEGRIHLVIDGGQTPGGVPSTVVDCTGSEPIILREGPITMADIESVLKQKESE
ncbi:MAG: threonylcarbamoyl-AMP synthase [Chloroflexi bacterium]|nr:MAG: threonylcarbamoyl-AMP synthase [Chloroflexota bacterium]